MKTKPAQCRCGQIIYLVVESGLRWTAEMTPLDRQGAILALTGGQELYLVDGDKMRVAPPELLAAGPGASKVVASHPCPPGAAVALERNLGGPGAQGTPPVPPVAPQNRFSGQQGATPTVAAAVNPPSSPFLDLLKAEVGDPGKFRRTQPCEKCKQPIEIDGPEEYTAVELGAKVVWAVHEDC